MWVSRVDWPKCINVRGISKWLILKPIAEVTQENCVEREKGQTREDLGGYQRQGEDEGPAGAHLER